jgi:outer membrane protein OmpA-like peptidoglycan-associated protein
VSELNGSLAQSRTAGAQLEHTLSAVDAVGMDVSFRTDDTSIKAEDMGPLLKLGALAAAVPDAKLRVAGFADPRGDAAYNDALSQRRAEAVAAALVCGGMARERLIIEAHGASESTSAAGDLDGYALDRRVTVRLERATSMPRANEAAASSGDVTPGTGP